jgi:hypothetical protein
MSKFKNLLMHSLAKWLVLAFLLLVTSVMGLGGFALHQLDEVNETTADIRTHWLSGTRNLGDSGANLIELRQLVSLHLGARDSEEKLDIEQAITGEQLSFRSSWAGYVATVTDPQEKELYESFLQHLGEYERELPKLLILSNSQFRDEAKTLYWEHMEPSYKAALSEFYRLVDLKWQNADSTVKQAENAYSVSRTLLIAAVSGFVTLLIISGALFRYELHGTVLAIQGRYQDHWVETESATLIENLQGIENSSELARGLVSRITPLIGGVLGGFYLHLPTTGRYHLIGGYGYRGRQGLVQAFAKGEGMVGECANHKTILEINDLPEDFFYQVGDNEQIRPDCLLVAPVICSDGDVLGVVEIAYIGGLLPQAHPLLEMTLPLVAEQMQYILQQQRTEQNILV